MPTERSPRRMISEKKTSNLLGDFPVIETLGLDRTHAHFDHSRASDRSVINLCNSPCQGDALCTRHATISILTMDTLSYL
mmetsp:Transcript_31304/g.65325  ORF Transcript_31304/g.65325 Transcript_31304/m.65325 type:complete len:80 (+) Transcript_31304:827-1066(+)